MNRVSSVIKIQRCWRKYKVRNFLFIERKNKSSYCFTLPKDVVNIIVKHCNKGFALKYK